jgi:cell division transport system permease protein
MKPSGSSRRRRRSVPAFIRNALRILFVDSLKGWRRDMASFVPAVGAMTLLLLMLGVGGIVAVATMTVLNSQTHEAAVLHLYVREGITDEPGGLVTRLREDPRVRSVTYISKSEALTRAQQHPGLSDLARASDSNPFPASLEVQLARVEDVSAVDASVRDDPNLDPRLPSSYDAGTYERIRQALRLIEAVGAGILLIVLLVAVGVTGAAIRGVALARRDELAVMHLVGAPAWMIRGPFAVQGAASGMVAGILAGVAVLGICAAGLEAAQMSFLGWLPGLSVEIGLLAAAATVAAGIGLGTVASLVELRGLK